MATYSAERRHRMRLAMFHAGQQAFARTFPAVANKRPDLTPFYICPLCVRGFPIEALADGRLTLEHVPPKSSGGKELVLTCKNCNHHSGENMDDHMMKADRPIAFLRGEHGGGQLADLRLEDGSAITVRLAGGGNNMIMLGKDGADPPSERKAFLAGLNRIVQDGQAGKLGYSFKINFKQDQHSEQRARVGWLRAAFLAAFASSGYRYALGPALNIVRRQIQEPEAELLPRTFRVIVPDAKLTTRRIGYLEQPAELKGIFVQMRWHMILLPHRSDVSFYDRVREASSKPGSKLQGSGEEVDWPKTATYAGDPPTEPTQNI